MPHEEGNLMPPRRAKSNNLTVGIPQFRIDSKTFGLTYSQCPLSPETVLEFLRMYNAVYVLVAQETHQDGNYHLHAMVYFDKRQSIRRQTFFDIVINSDLHYHPSIESVRDSTNWWNYCTKGGVFLEWGERDAALTKLKQGTWKDVLDCKTREDYLLTIKDNFPREFANNLEKLMFTADYLFKKDTPEYVSNPDYKFVLPLSITNWLQDEFNGTHDRPKSLVLVGPSRTGKTEWARSLGTHNYFNDMVNFAEWNEDAGYTIFDDFEFESYMAKHWKSWFGCQKEFTVTDKYTRKKVIRGRRPFIWLCNTLPLWPDIAWKNANIIIVNVDKQLY